MKERLTLAFLVIACGVGNCQTALRIRAADGQTFEAQAFVEAGSFEGRTGASLCLIVAGKRLCHSMLPRLRGEGLDPLVFALDPSFETIGDPGATAIAGAILFKADAEPFLSRRDTRVMLFVLKRGPELVSVLPDVFLSEQSEYLTWEDKGISSMPIITTADYNWSLAAGETHFARHHYSIRSYVWNASAFQYELLDGFSTSSRYPGFDEVQKIQVISHEIAVVKARLGDIVASPK